MDADWDLQAVVRGCCSAASSSSAAATATATTPTGCSQQKSTPTFCEENNIDFLTFYPDLFQPKFMNDIYNCNPLQFSNLPKQPPPPPQRLLISTFSFLGQDPPYHHQYNHQQLQQNQLQVKQQSLGISRCTTAHAQSATKIKKRKNQIKKVCQVPAEGSTPDLWSWRKYGQKPIKGSPYPRGYYKCSTLKGCSARKQVERNRSDPGMLIITYTGEHSHPVPTQVAGGIRSKTVTSVDDDTGNKATPSPPISPVATLLPMTEKGDEIERDDTDDDNNFDVSGLVIDEDTFDGLDELVGSTVGDFFSDDHTASNPAPPFRGCRITWPSPPPLQVGVDF